MESSQLWFSDEGEALNVKIGQVQLTGDSLYGVFQTEDGHDVWLEVDFNGCHHWGNPIAHRIGPPWGYRSDSHSFH